MLNIVCVKWGTKYGPEYVNILLDMVARNLPASVAFRFICFTDDPAGINPAVQIRELPEGVEGWYNKLYLFKHGLFDEGDRILFFDLDTVIVGGLDDLAAYEGKFTILRDFYRGGRCYQSAVMAWKANHCCYIWDDWIDADKPQLEGGDQAWIEYKLSNALLFQDLFPSVFVSFKVHARNGIPKDAKIICFHGVPRPHEVTEGWVPKVWKVGGVSTFDIASECNTHIHSIEQNIRSALAARYKTLDAEIVKHKGHAVIVGGGPSIAGFIEELKMRQSELQTIFALNNSWRWLMKQGIDTDIHVLLDARKENEAFVPTTGENCVFERFYASQCHPDILKAADGPLLTVWHALIPEIVDSFADQDMFWVGCGTSVGLRAIFLAYCLGYREFHLYGFDSSYQDDEGHAYKQPLNADEKVMDVELEGRKFKSAPWMITQMEEFLHIMEVLTKQGCVFTIHGDGLLQHAVKTCLVPAAEAPSAAMLRGQSILDHISSMENPVGVEVGVFAGELSQFLLASRGDMTLYLVDSWKVHDQSSEYAKTDFHGKLSQTQQDSYLQMTKSNVEFAGPRARILRHSSVEAAGLLTDGSLDFAFIDADHTYEAVKADLLAWFPKIRAGGVISGHDYNHPEFPEWGVKKAVDEFAQLHGFTIQTGQNYTWFIHT